MGLTVSTAPTKTDIVSVADVKTHLRIPSADTAEDSYLSMLVEAVYDQVEGYLGRPLLDTTYTLTLDGWPDDSIILLRPSLQSITSVKYYDTDNSQQTLATSDYQYNTTDLRPKIKLINTPSVYDNRMDSVEVIYVSGYGDEAADVPADIKLCIRKLIALHYRDREDTPGASVFKLPSLIRETLIGYKNFTFESV